jgi:hypothetical protein
MLILTQGDTPDQITARWASPEEETEIRKRQAVEALEALALSFRILELSSRMVFDLMASFYMPRYGKPRKRKIVQRLKR